MIFPSGMRINKSLEPDEPDGWQKSDKESVELKYIMKIY